MNVGRSINGLLHRFGYRLTRIEEADDYPAFDVLDLLVQRLRGDKPDIFFVQIGANDGVTEDPLQPLIGRYGLRGLSVEPQPRAFDRLQQSRGRHPGMMFENAIIADEDGAATLFVPSRTANLPEQLSQAASLDRAQLAGVLSADRGADALIDAVTLPSLTLASLLAKHGVRSIDLLILDTMGFDFRIISQLDFASSAPAIIQFEERILPRRDRHAARQLLAAHGYSFCNVAADTIAVRDGPVRGSASRPSAVS